MNASPNAEKLFHFFFKGPRLAQIPSTHKGARGIISCDNKTSVGTFCNQNNFMTTARQLIITALSLLYFSAFAQGQETPKGTIKAKVIDKGTLQTVPFATIIINGTQIGATTGTTGIFTLTKVNEGVYQLTASYIGYQEKKQLMM